MTTVAIGSDAALWQLVCGDDRQAFAEVVSDAQHFDHRGDRRLEPVAVADLHEPDVPPQTGRDESLSRRSCPAPRTFCRHSAEHRKSRASRHASLRRVFHPGSVSPSVPVPFIDVESVVPLVEHIDMQASNLPSETRRTHLSNAIHRLHSGRD